MHGTSQIYMKDFVDKYLSAYLEQPLNILDIGSKDEGGTYKESFNRPNWVYKGLDIIPGGNVDIVVKEKYNWMEIEDGSYDVVISGQAFEHIEYIWDTMLEIARVLKKDGLVCVICPSKWEEHKFPVDCWRILPDGMRALAKYASLEIIDVFMKEISTTQGDTVLICKK